MLRKKAKVVEVRQRAKEKYLQSQKIKGQNFIQSAKNHFFILLNEVSRNTTPFLSSLLIFAEFCYQSSLRHEKRRMKNVWYEFAIRHLSREDADNCLVRWGLQSEKVSIEFNDPSATTANVIQFYDYCSSGNFFRLTFVNFLAESYVNCIYFFISHRLKFKMI